MNIPSVHGTWDILPATVIVSLYQYLTLKETLVVSSVCKKWREVLLQARHILWEKLTLDLRPEKAKWKKELKLHQEMCLRFSAFTKYLIINWCACDVASATNFFTQLPKFRTKYRALRVRRIKCAKKSRRPSCLKSVIAPPDFVEALKTCIAKCTCLNHLSFGYCCDKTLLSIFCDQCFEKRKPLTTLNISCAGNSEMKPLAMTYPVWLYHLQSLTMDWDMITGNILNGLLTAIRKGKMKMERLNIVISCKDSGTNMTSCEIEWTHFFDQLKSCNYKLTVGLVLIAVEARPPFEQFEPLFHSSVPVEHVLIVHTVQDGYLSMENYKRMVRKFHSLHTLTVQGIEPDDEFPNETTQGDAWIDIASGSEISTFSIFGVYIDVDEILRLLQRKADVNFSFTCSKYDVVKKGIVLDYLIPLTGDRKALKELERKMHMSRGSWTAGDKMPIQRTLKRKGERVENIVHYVLSEGEDAF